MNWCFHNSTINAIRHSKACQNGCATMKTKIIPNNRDCHDHLLISGRLELRLVNGVLCSLDRRSLVQGSIRNIGSVTTSANGLKFTIQLSVL